MTETIHEITQSDLDQVAAELDAARKDLNSLSHSFNQVNTELLTLSEQMDALILKYMRMMERYKLQQKKLRKKRARKSAKIDHKEDGR